MLRKIILGAAALVATGTALPAAAEAQYYRDYDPRYSRGYDNYRSGYHDRGYYGRDYDRGYYGRSGYDRRYHGRGYDRDYYGRSAYGRSAYDGRYYGRSYGYDRGYRRCGNGSTGAIVGGAAGALLGREIARGGRYSYHRRGNGTVGAIVGGAAGALIGREIARSC